MNISIVDGSNYFRGLLLLIAKDHKTTEQEKELMRRIGKSLGFEEEFCDNAIHEILENRHIVDTIPEFSKRELAIKFIKDGLALAFSDNELHPAEEQWLKDTALRNGLDLNWFHQESEEAANRDRLPPRLEADALSVEYY